MQVASYLFFNGNCEEAFNRYQQVLGGRIVGMLRPGDAPGSEECTPDMAGKIMHACLELDGQNLMGSDCPEGQYQKPQGFSVCLTVKSREEAERIFTAMSEGGNVLMPLAQTFWADRFGMVVDRFGTPWMINHVLPRPQG
jgi:PhnB protein